MQGMSGQDRGSSNYIWWLLLLVGALAAVRIASCAQYAWMDEEHLVRNLAHFYKNRTLLPSHFNYPTLFSYLSAVPTGAWVMVLHWAGVVPSVADFGVLHLLGSRLPLLPGRALSALFGAATILMVFRIGERFFDRRTGFAAGAALGFSGLHIQFSALALPDVTMTFWATCAIYFSLCALRSGAVRDFALAGAFVGLAASTKYNGGLIILAIMAVLLIALRDRQALLSPRAWLNRYSVVAGVAFACAFLIGSPGWVLEPHSFWEALVYERSHMAEGHLGSFGIPYGHHLAAFWEWETTLALLFGAGVLRAIVRRSREVMVLLAVAVPSFILVGSWQKRDLHYLLFLYPVLALLGGLLVSEISLWVERRAGRSLALLTVSSVFIVPICSSAISAWRCTREDSRWVAYRWIQSHIPEGSRMVVDWAYLPTLITEENKRDWREEISQKFYDRCLAGIRTYRLIDFEYNPSWLREVEADYLVTSSYCYDRFFTTAPPPPDNPLAGAYQRRRETYVALTRDGGEALGWRKVEESWTGNGPRILIYSRHPFVRSRSSGNTRARECSSVSCCSPYRLVAPALRGLEVNSTVRRPSRFDVSLASWWLTDVCGQIHETREEPPPIGRRWTASPRPISVGGLVDWTDALPSPVRNGLCHPGRYGADGTRRVPDRREPSRPRPTRLVRFQTEVIVWFQADERADL